MNHPDAQEVADISVEETYVSFLVEAMAGTLPEQEPHHHGKKDFIHGVFFAPVVTPVGHLIRDELGEVRKILA